MKELLLLTGLGVLALVSGLFNLRKMMMPLVIIGLLANIGLCIHDWDSSEVVYNMLILDNFALAFTMIFSATSIIWFISAADYFNDDNNFSDHYALVLFSMTGGFLLVSFSNMVMLFLGLEILSIPLFVLVGSNKTKLRSNEAAFKYFLLGSFASAFMLFGITLIYGTTGSFNNQAISVFLSQPGVTTPLLFAGMLCLLMSMAFKVSAAPFHFWAPDVYQGAPTHITAYMSTVVKTVAFAAFFRLFKTTFDSLQWEYMTVLAILAALTLLIANITAAVQENVKRMLAYSSISHAGFMLVTILTIRSNSAGLLLYYAMVYSVSSICAFAVLKQVKLNSGGREVIDTFKGLLGRNKLMTFSMILALLSMSGIPPLAGFMAKYLVFVAAINNGYMWLAIIGVVASLIAVYYYFKVIIVMCGKSEGEENSSIILPAHIRFLLIICCIGMILLAIIPDTILGLL
jgi:NADH-quinone oxidoreductase subunit N